MPDLKCCPERAKQILLAAPKPLVMLAIAALLIAAPLPSFAAGGGASQFLKKPDAWFATAEAQPVAAHILSFQSELGGWPKNTNTAAAPYTGDPKELKPTFDNGATTDELRFLARIYNATKEERYRRAFEKGYAYILKAQYPTGGWPQFYPPPKTSYHRHITFNDSAMVRLMEFLRETWTSHHYAFLAPERSRSARAAFERGVQCILRCQIKVDGRLTAWCAQHDELDYRPAIGRAYELPSLSGAESVGITRLLMSLENPSPEIRQAIEAAVAWFQASEIKGIRIVQEPDAKAPKGKNKVVRPAPSAPSLWARFYEIGSNKPIFVDRDGVPKYELAQIGYERRNGYAWYGDWPESLLKKDYPAWKARAISTAPGH